MEVQERNWLNGARLVAWLEERGFPLTATEVGGHDRAIRHWRDGGACSIFQADRLLTKLDVHLHEVPDGLWLEETPKKGSFVGPRRRFAYPPEVRAEAVRRVMVGEEPLKAVAQSVGCSPKAIRNWIARAA